MMDFTKINQEWGYAPAVQPAGQAGTPSQGQPKTSVTKKDSTATTPTIGGGTPMANTGNNFIYPTEWDNLGDQWGQMASGNYTNPGMDWLTKLM